jgi:hypothetical protein
MQGRMKVTPRGSNPERRHKTKVAQETQGKEDANNSVTKHTYPGEGAMTADEVMIGS